FFRQNYSPARVCLVGLTDPLYELIRIGQSKITPDGKRSKWNHAFLMGERRGGLGKEKIFILESDFHFSFKEFQFINGPQGDPEPSEGNTAIGWNLRKVACVRTRVGPDAAGVAEGDRDGTRYRLR
ncbi:MAG: hypothetical protein AAB393_12785, partial [Bacteroidota bacterium]